MESTDVEFNNLVNSIKDAEQKAAKTKSSAESEVYNILKTAKEEAAKLSLDLEESIVQKKNKLLEQGSTKIESKVESLIADAKSEASKIIKKKLKTTKINSLSISIIE